MQPAHPCTGTAAGVPYLALPPTSVDVEADGPTRLIVAWHGFEPPRSEAAFAAAVPMTGVPAWRVYLGLPLFGGRLPAGGAGELRALAQHDYLVDLYGPIVEQAAAELPEVVAALRVDLGLAETPIGLVGFSAGGGAALLALASGEVPVDAAALIAPIVVPARALAGLERRSGGTYAWTDESRAVAARLDFNARAAEVVASNPALMLLAGGADDLVPPGDLAGFRNLLLAAGGSAVEAATFRMGHALAAEPGITAHPPIAEAVSVDGALTEFFLDHYADHFAVRRRRPEDGPAELEETAPWPEQAPTVPIPSARPVVPTRQAGSWTSAAPTLSATLSR